MSDMVCYLYFDNEDKINSKFDKMWKFYVDLQKVCGIEKER